MSKNTFRLIVLRNENSSDHYRWIEAIENSGAPIIYKIIDLTRNNWLDHIIDFEPDFLLAKPGGLTLLFKQLYDERLMILVNDLGYKCYPTLDEILIYENKRYLSYWLKAHEVPHPKTNVFYFKQEAINFLKSTDLPVIAKTNIGASGSGVSILKNLHEVLDYIKETFDGRGAKKRWGPNFSKGGWVRRGLHYVFHPRDINKKIDIYKQRRDDSQRDFVIFQEFIPHEFEWRCVRIGDSFFAHKKLLNNEKASGSLLKGYENPPMKILDFIFEITEKHNLTSVAIDFFETETKGYLVNEIQCFFGQSDPYQMLVDGKPGRYIRKHDKWIFEEGDFNTNESFDLRIQHILKLIKRN